MKTTVNRALAAHLLKDVRTANAGMARAFWQSIGARVVRLSK